MADIISTGANVVLVIIAIVALIVAFHQIRVSREIEAISAYEQYHHLVMERPELSADFDTTTRNDAERVRYVFFVMSMLLTIERVLALFPDDRHWAEAFKDDIMRHRRFLCSPEFAAHLQSLDPKVAAFISETARELEWTEYNPGQVRIRRA